MDIKDSFYLLEHYKLNVKSNVLSLYNTNENFIYK